jgi:hypothetical protein
LATVPLDVLQRGVCADAAAAQARGAELVCQRQLKPDRGLGDVELGVGCARACGAGVGVMDAAQLSEVVARVARCRQVAGGCLLVALRSQIEAIWTSSGGVQLSLSPRGLQLP